MALLRICHSCYDVESFSAYTARKICSLLSDPYILNNDRVTSTFNKYSNLQQIQWSQYDYEHHMLEYDCQG